MPFQSIVPKIINPIDFAALIVEDDNEMRALLKSLMRPLGFTRIVGIANAEDALSQVHFLSFEVAVIDLHLGSGSGLDVISAIRTSGRRDFNNIPILVASAASTGARIQAAMSAGADAYLTKPFSISNLTRQLKLAFDKSRLRSAGALGRSGLPTLGQLQEFLVD